jgi:hypothetical protein
VSGENALGEEIQQIRDRLRAMKTEREAAMSRLVESREHAEAQRQVRVETERPPDEPSARP